MLMRVHRAVQSPPAHFVEDVMNMIVQSMLTCTLVRTRLAAEHNECCILAWLEVAKHGLVGWQFSGLLGGFTRGG
jgi:hypothetical protein